MEFQEEELVFPGDVIGSGEEFTAGSGTFLCESSGSVKASLLGHLACATSRTAEDTCVKGVVHVIPVAQSRMQDAVIDIGDIVTGRVIRLSSNQAYVTILAVGDTPLRSGQQPSALVRKEDIRLTDTDSLVLHECFRPGDIIEAAVISLGDARQYFLSTALPQCGVRWARGEEGRLLVPVSWKEMQDPVSKVKESRKVAKPRAGI